MDGARLDIQHRHETLFFCPGEYKRPEIKLDVYEIRDSAAKRAIWEVFRKYHYLNTDLQLSCRQFVGVIDGEIVAHTGIIHFPLRKGWKRVHRFVVLPDYQGIGVGMAFIKQVAQIIKKDGYRLNLTTTTPALVKALTRSKHWRLVRFGRVTGSMAKLGKHFEKSISSNRITYSFNYSEI